MASSDRVAVVTGSNKGLGFGIVRGLCKQFDGDVYLTARREDLGKKAVEDLNKEGLHPKFHQLDITDASSINRFKSFLQRNYGGLDILVNNAGLGVMEKKNEAFSEQSMAAMRTNFWGTLNVCNALFPLLRSHARVVNVSSTTVQVTWKYISTELKHKFSSTDITMDQLCQLMQNFVDCAKEGTHVKKGWPRFAYPVSKLGVAVMSCIQQRQLDRDLREDIIVNAVCPGFVNTDMTSHKGIKTIDEGADTPLYAALLPPNTKYPKGVIIHDRTVIGFDTHIVVNTKPASKL